MSGPVGRLTPSGLVDGVPYKGKSAHARKASGLILVEDAHTGLKISLAPAPKTSPFQYVGSGNTLVPEHKTAEYAASFISRGRLRVDCMEVPEFWLEITIAKQG